jgi:hypothetical protein
MGEIGRDPERRDAPIMQPAMISAVSAAHSTRAQPLSARTYWLVNMATPAPIEAAQNEAPIINPA